MHHYSFNYREALDFMLDKNCSLLEASVDGDHSNFTYLNSWQNHYLSWKNNKDFDVLFIKYEDIEKNKYEIFEKVVLFVDKLSNKNIKLDEKKLINSINSTNFSSLRNKELNQGFDESVSSKSGKKLNFFNLGFKNRWQKLLPVEIKDQLNEKFKKGILELNYPND